MIWEMRGLSDPRAKTKHKFHLRAKSKNKNKMSFNCQILDQKLPFPNQTVRIKTGVFFEQMCNDLPGAIQIGQRQPHVV